MQKKFRKTLFIFRRDLRLEDNTGLIFALESSQVVIPAFILTPEQIEKNPFKSDFCLQFMIESLQDLGGQLEAKGAKLFLFKGEPQALVSQCLQELSIDALIVNRDYTPYSRQRDAALEELCQAHAIAFYAFDDVLLQAPEKTLKKDKKPYSVFTPYFQNASKLPVPRPVANKYTNYFREAIPFAQGAAILDKLSPQVKGALRGGRAQALKTLQSLSVFQGLEQLRDLPIEACTTHLSAYLKFTVCSVREVYYALIDQLGAHHGLVRSLYWRDFFTSIAFFFPHVFRGSFHPKFDAIKWSHASSDYQQWCEGLTGFPIIDAGMRELKATGFMHNRVRMLTASFLVKDLHIDWRWGERYFASVLIDYDPAVNNGNWQWVASTGCDAQPYFRLFNPWLQQKKFDPDCRYIKKWIPELELVEPKSIHGWYEKKYRAAHSRYPSPMIDHQSASRQTLHLYQSI